MDTASIVREYEPIVAGDKYIEDFVGVERPEPAKIFIFSPVLNIIGVPFNVSEGDGLFTVFNRQWPSLATTDNVRRGDPRCS